MALKDRILNLPLGTHEADFKKTTTNRKKKKRKNNQSQMSLNKIY